MGHAAAASNGHLAFRFRTEDWAEHERMAAIQDIYARVICRFELEPSPDRPVYGDAQLRGMPGLGVAQVTSSKARARRTPADAIDDELLLTVWLDGQCMFDHRGREVTLAAGDASLTTCAERAAMTFTDSRYLSFRLPAKEIAARVPDVADRTARLIRRDTDALKLLTSYAGILMQGDALTPDARRLAVTHVHDLVALGLGATQDSAQVARQRGARAARLHAIKADIADHVASPDLSVHAISIRHRLPVRYVQRLFEEDGTSFTGYLLEQRLARARQVLANPRLANLKVSAVAIEAGFCSLSYFNEAFRRRYGASPSELRAQVRRGH